MQWEGDGRWREVLLFRQHNAEVRRKQEAAGIKRARRAIGKREDYEDGVVMAAGQTAGRQQAW